MKSLRALHAALLLSAAWTAAAADRPHLVRFTSERSAVRSGGHMSPGCFTILTAQIAPPAEGVEVGFRIAPGSGEGRASPAMLSRETTLTDVNGLARTFLLSSDAEEECRVEASLAPPASAEGQAPSEVRPTLTGVEGVQVRLEVRVRFSRSPAEGAVVASRSAAGGELGRRSSFRPLGSGGALSFARYLADPAVEVRTAAKRTLVSLGRKAVEALVEVASDPDFPPEARRLAVTTLAEITDDEADDRLLALLAHPLPDVRAGAEEAIARIAAARALPLARAAVLSVEPGVRASGLRVLGTLPTDPAASIIASKLADPDPFVRATAAWEIARSGPGALSGPGGAGRKRPGAEGLLGRTLA
ncbi:MAG: HEAT repeat domain-containing protein, partial [Planctomycetota bacterium]